MYLSSAIILNSGSISRFIFDAQIKNGLPQPTIFVGGNGSGKTNVLSIFADALVEIAKSQLAGVTEDGAYLRVLAPRNVRINSNFELAAAKFYHDDQTIFYRSKTGAVKHESLAEEMKNYAPVASWPERENVKDIQGKFDNVEAIFREGAYAFFPAMRFELPHWANSKVLDRDPDADFSPRYSGRLNKPIVLSSSLQSLKPWLIDVFLDATISPNDVFTAGDLAQLRTKAVAATANASALLSINEILSKILKNPNVRVGRGYRSLRERRINVAEGNVAIIPSLDNLSAGQAILFSIFGTILRYADMGNPGVLLKDISGMVLIDEIDAHLHADLQYEVLPSLIAAFPKVQFVVSSHSPLFILGMEKAFGENLSIIELPTGTRLTAERFSEFATSLSYFRATASFENDLKEYAKKNAKPLILCEGETDPKYLQTAAILLGKQALLDRLDFEWIGKKTAQGTDGSGNSHLDQAWKFLRNNSNARSRSIMLLYDCDSGKPDTSEDGLFVRTITKNEANKVRQRGIENLLPDTVFEEKFFKTFTRKKGDEDVTTRSLAKVDLCNYLCDEKKSKDDFVNFENTLLEIEKTFQS